MQRIAVICHGQTVHVDQNDDGTYTCACGEQKTSVVLPAGWPPNRRQEDADRERFLAGFEPDWKADEQERREDLISRPDFERPAA